MPENPNESLSAASVTATGHVVQIPTRLAGLFVALFLLVPVGSAFVIGRGTAPQPQVVVYQLPTSQQPATGATLQMADPTAPGEGAAALGPQPGVMPGPIDELRKLIESLRPENLVPDIIKVIAQSITGIDPEKNEPTEGRPDIASQIGTWVLQTPNFASPGFAGTAAIRDFIDALRAAGWALLLVTAAAAAIKF